MYGSLGSLGTRVHASLVYIRKSDFQNKRSFCSRYVAAVHLLKHGVRSDPTDPITMPTTEGSAEEGQPSGSREHDRTTQLKPPAPLDFEAVNLADSWKRWRQEVEMYMDLAMCGREESMKVRLFLYLLGSQGREIYSTMTFEAPVHERNLKQVMDDETVERYKFFSRFENQGVSKTKANR